MTETRTISNNDEVIDSRDIIKRIEELEDRLEELNDPDATEPLAEDEQTEKEEVEQELKALHTLEEEASGSPDWQCGETLVRDSYFAEYAEQLAEDTGAISREAQWPLNCIDWEEAAEQLKQDYMSADFDGVEYWIRA